MLSHAGPCWCSLSQQREGSFPLCAVPVPLLLTHSMLALAAAQSHEAECQCLIDKGQNKLAKISARANNSDLVTFKLLCDMRRDKSYKPINLCNIMLEIVSSYL